MYQIFRFHMHDCFSNRYTIHDYIDYDPRPVLEISGNPEGSTMLHIHVLFMWTQFTFRQRRLSLGRCEHKLDALCPLHTDHLLPTCNYGRFHRTLKSVARSWQYVCYTRVVCKSRSAIAHILYLDIIQNLPSAAKYSWSRSYWSGWLTLWPKKRDISNTYLDHWVWTLLSVNIFT